MIQELTENEKPRLIPVCNQGYFFVESTGVKQCIILEEVPITDEILEEVDKSMEECKVGHDKLFEVLPSVKDISHHGMIIFRDFEDLFLHNNYAQNYNIQRFLDWS